MTQFTILAATAIVLLGLWAGYAIASVLDWDRWILSVVVDASHHHGIGDEFNSQAARLDGQGEMTVAAPSPLQLAQVNAARRAMHQSLGQVGLCINNAELRFVALIEHVEEKSFGDCTRPVPNMAEALVLRELLADLLRLKKRAMNFMDAIGCDLDVEGA